MYAPHVVVLLETHYFTLGNLFMGFSYGYGELGRCFPCAIGELFQDERGDLALLFFRLLLRQLDGTLQFSDHRTFLLPFYSSSVHWAKKERLLELMTIGYEGRTLAEAIALMQEQGVDVVLDVRQFAWSRKRGFSKAQLSAALASAGIGYLHDARLGSPLPLRKRYRETGDWNAFSEGYAYHLGTQGDLLREYARALADRRVCLLCFEEDHARCHRSLIASELEEMLHIRAGHL